MSCYKYDIVHICMCEYAYMCVSRSACVYTCICMYLYVGMFACMYVCTYACVYMHIYTMTFKILGKSLTYGHIADFKMYD